MPVNKSVPGSHATKMEISGRTLVPFRKKWRNGEILIIFRAFAFTHSFALHTCKLGQRKRKCKRKVKTAWTRGRLLRLHLSRTCEPGLYKFWESILQSQILMIKSCMIELQLYAYLSGDFFSDLSQRLTLATNREYELRKALICRKPLIPTYFQ